MYLSPLYAPPPLPSVSIKEEEDIKGIDVKEGTPLRKIKEEEVFVKEEEDRLRSIKEEDEDSFETGPFGGPLSEGLMSEGPMSEGLLSEGAISEGHTSEVFLSEGALSEGP